MGVQKLADHLAAGPDGAPEVDLHLLDVHEHLGVHAAQVPYAALHLHQVAPGEGTAQLEAAGQADRGRLSPPALARCVQEASGLAG